MFLSPPAPPKTPGFLVLSVGIKWENKLLAIRACLIFQSKINPSVAGQNFYPILSCSMSTR